MTPRKPSKPQRRIERVLAMLGAVTVLIGIATCAPRVEMTIRTPGLEPAPPVRRQLGDPNDPVIRFSHRLHFEQATCLACHMTVEEEAEAGRPTLEDCLDCHDGPQSEKPEDLAEEKKLEYYAALQKEIPWPTIGVMSPDVIFSHKTHIVEGELACEDCHGDIAETDDLPLEPAYPYDHQLCGECHDTEEDESGCKTCHSR